MCIFAQYQYNMAAKKYSLSIENIGETAKEFISTHPAYSITIKEKDNIIRIEITHLKKCEIGILNCHITRGQVSYSIQGKSNQFGICNKCWEYIVENASIPQIDQKCFSLKNVNSENFDALIKTIEEYGGVEIISCSIGNNNKIRNKYYLKGKYNARISIIFYNNGTLMIQGAITSFYVEFIMETLQLVSDVPSEVIKEVFTIQSRSGYILDTDLNKHISNIEHISGSVIENFINTSICLANSGVKVDDYGCYTFGVLKALDAIISTRILEDAPEFNNYGDYFERKEHNEYHFCDNIITYDNNQNLKRALEKGYSFFKKHRHSTFHVDNSNIETSRTLDYDEAIGIIKDCLTIINNICTNW